MRALVSGGTRGIGLACAQALVDDGIEVFIAARHWMQQVPKGMVQYKFDALRHESINDLIASVGDIDILLNNCGGGGRWGDYDICKTDIGVWDEVYQKNAGAAIQLTRACLPHMVERGFGRVICITSIYAHKAAPRPWFGMAKAAQVALMASLAIRPEYVRRGITFNTVAPGIIDIAGTGSDTEDIQRIDTLPLGRMGKPGEVANIVAFLCSPKASLVNGANIIVDGGESA